MVVADFITENIGVFKKLLRLGKISITVINQYDIYIYYNSLPNDLNKMQRYSQTSDIFKLSEKTIRNSIKEMEREC